MDSVVFDEDSISVSAVIKTRSGVAEAFVYWTTDTTSGFNSLPMVFVNADTAVGYIPQQIDGTEIFYYVSAKSNSGRTVAKPLVAPDGYYNFVVENSVTNISEIFQPEKFYLNQNYPNPFNPSTKIKFTIKNVTLSEAKNLVTLKVYDVLGNEITTLVNEVKPAGSYVVEFNAEELPSGIYFYRLQVDSFVQTRKMILLK